MNKTLSSNWIIAIILVFLHAGIFGQKEEDNDSSTTTSSDSSESVTIESLTAPCTKYEGLFTIYQDTTNGSVFMLVNKDQIGKEYIHFVYIVDGVLDAGHFRGAYRENKIFKVEKYFNRIELVTQNTSYYFDEENPLSKAASANISRSIMASNKIEAEDKEKGQYLIKGDDLFLTETISQVKPSPDPNTKPGERFSLGTLNKDKTKYISINNYPMNTDVVVEYTYDNPAPVNSGSDGVTDPRFVSVTMQHSFIKVPQNDFKPRLDDPRVGYFTNYITDMTSTKVTPYRDPIHRWHLEKKDPDAVLSEPVEPIVWWVENTTLLEFRDVVAKGVLEWNKAFEEIGFKDAI